MAIEKKAKVGATSTHSNDPVKVEDNTQELLNHQQPETLVDPEDDEGGSTHSVTASVDGQDSLDELEHCEPEMKVEGDNDDTQEQMGEAMSMAEGLGEVPLVADAPDLTDGEAPVADDPDGISPGTDVDAADSTNTADVPEVPATPDAAPSSDEGVENGSKPNLLETDDEWDVGGPTHSDEEVTADGEFDEDDYEDDFVDDGEPMIEDEVEEDADVPAGADDMDLVDVDNMDDSAEDVTIASIGAKLIAIRANRIVATLGKKAATVAGHADVYLGDQFAQVVEAEMNTKGMRKGLKDMGFTLAKVNVTKTETVNARVDKKVAASTAAIRKVSASKEKAFQESLAIASVGLNRGRWQDVQNPLKAHLVDELTAAGVRNAGRMVHQIFAQYGIDYAKALVTVATKLSGMPQAARDALTASFDMTNEYSEDEDLEDDEEDGEEVEDEFADGDFGSDAEAPQSVNAALSTAGFRSKAALLNPKSVGYSVSAAKILAGDEDLPLY